MRPVARPQLSPSRVSQQTRLSVLSPVGKAARADSPRATPATLPTELYAVCCMPYTAKSCPWFRVTASRTWPGRVTQAQGHHCGSSLPPQRPGQADGAREAEPHQVGWGHPDLEARAEGTEISQGWRLCGAVIPGAAGPTLRVIWVVVAVKATVTRAPGPGLQPVLLQGSRGDGAEPAGVLGSSSVRKNRRAGG